KGLGPETAGISGVAIVQLVLRFFTGYNHLAGVDDDNVVPGIYVWGKGGLVLAAKYGSDFRSKPAQGLAFGVNDKPPALDLLRFGHIGVAHSLSSLKQILYNPGLTDLYTS